MNPDVFDEEEGGATRARWFKRAGLIVGLLVAVGLVVAVIGNLMANTGPHKKQGIARIALLRPPPPPTPAEKPPEPPIKKEEVKMPEPDKPPDPQPAQAEPPPGPDLGVDAKGTGTGDSFGLVGKPGGKDITTIGGGGGGGNQFTWYAGLVQAEIQKALARNAKLRGAEFKAKVNIWMNGDGKVQRSELEGSTGNAETDQQLRLALSELPPLREAPPGDMPQPIRLRITSRF